MNKKFKLSKGVKHDQEKRRFSLFPTRTLYAVVDVLEYGARKYEEENWRKVPDSRKRYYDASMRHINDWWMGETHDPESGHHHLAHAMCCLVFLLTVDLEENQVGKGVKNVSTDRPLPIRRRRRSSSRHQGR